MECSLVNIVKIQQMNKTIVSFVRKEKENNIKRVVLFCVECHLLIQSERLK